MARQLAKTCSRHDQEHTCKDLFREHPAALLKWRMLWYSLPSCDRHARIVNMFLAARTSQQKEKLGDDQFSMKYYVLGQAVCRDAFIDLTCIAADTLQRARTQAMSSDIGTVVTASPVV